MPDCSYCGESFADEQEYLAHLDAEHEGELGAIDRRRVKEELESDDSGGVPTGPLVLGIVLGVSILLVGYVIFIHGSGGGGNEGTVNGISVSQMPGQTSESAHEHGYINVTIDGQQVDFSQPQYQGQAQAFHFENGDGRVWHKHAPGVTLEYAMATLGIEVTETSVTFQGTTYRDSDPDTNVSVTVNGDSVDPATHELNGASEGNPEAGDHIRIVVTTEE